MLMPNDAMIGSDGWRTTVDPLRAGQVQLVSPERAAGRQVMLTHSARSDDDATSLS
jgi:hypothetical protein